MAVHDISARVPDMTSDDLDALYANAVRLEQAGNPGERKRAAALLPMLVAERASRNAERMALARERTTAKAALRRTQRPKAAPAPGEDL